MGRSAAGGLLFIAAVAALSLVGQPAAADGFPSKPVRIIVPYTPGSPNDVMARLLAQHLQAKLGQAAVIDNKPGGGTTIGSKVAAAAPADGYTLLFASSALVIEPIMTKQIEYDPQKDFAPIAFVARTSLLLTINEQVPANSVEEFVVYAKANPGKLSLGFAQGTVSQLAAEYFNRLHRLDITSVPYRGGALVIPDMLGGRIHIYWPSPATVLPLIRAGRIKALATSSPERVSDLPDVPTMKELGLDQLSLEFWDGVWAPAGVPADIVEKLNAAINAALQSPEMIASMKQLGFESRIGSPQDFAAFVAAEIPRWTAVVKASGVQPQ
ncbi:MAG: tripartite tricarboxylate transporter substrate binding protein [Alphaproteobacteria bacterium]|nr:MAG: tripartite tricarboxylate transporter substrate binding protein [Alphaproteobacteria bacterium]